MYGFRDRASCSAPEPRVRISATLTCWERVLTEKAFGEKASNGDLVRL